MDYYPQLAGVCYIIAAVCGYAYWQLHLRAQEDKVLEDIEDEDDDE